MLFLAAMTHASKSNGTQPAPQSLALDTSCVVNLLSRDEPPDGALLKLFRFATQGRTTLSVTPILQTEVPGQEAGDLSDRGLNRKFIRERLGMFSVAEVNPSRQVQRDQLAERLLKLLWPNVEPGSRKRDHSLRDCQHIASLSLCGGGIFVSCDGELRRKARAQQDTVNVEVLSPEETLARFASVSPSTLAASSPIVRAARTDDADEISRLMDPIKSSYPQFDEWRRRALNGSKPSFVAVIDGQIAGVSVWSKKDDRVAKLSTFYVGDEYQGRGIGPHLLFHQLRLWASERIEKVYVTVSSERLHVLQFFFSYGFRIEGASTRRYKSGTSEFILSKHLFFERITDDQFDDFLKRLSAQVFALPKDDGVSAPARWFMPPSQFELQAARNEQNQVEHVAVCQSGRPSRQMTLVELEELTYPARFHLAGREAFMIPIQPKWADALMNVQRNQGLLFPNTNKLFLRTDNAFYCHPRMGPARLGGASALFYVSRPDQFIAGCARILDCRIADPEDLYVEFGDIGIYTLDEIREHVAERGGKYAGCAMALRFAWWVPFPKPVTLDSLRKGFDLQHPQTVTPIPYDLYERIVEAGGIDW